MHVILRGIDRAAIFFDGSDYRFFLNYLSDAAEAESVHVHAYVLMTNPNDGRERGGRTAGDEATGTALCATHQQDLSADRRSDRSRRVLAGVPALHRTEPGACGDGRGAGRLSLVELPGQRASGHADTVIRPHPLYHSLAASHDALRAAYRRLFETELDANLLQRLRECKRWFRSATVTAMAVA